MNRDDFGQLLAALRNDLGWTQAELAETADVDIAVISQIERGVKKFFEPDLLFNLINALQLTSVERIEFILAASGLDKAQMVRQPTVSMATDAFNAKKVLDKLVKVVENLRLPAFIIDSYGDFVAVNLIVLGLYQISPSVIETAPNTPGGYNAIRVNFNRELIGRSQIADNWDQYAINSIRTFREISLSYRSRPYFKHLMKSFSNPTEYPFFQRYWKMLSSAEQDRDASIDYFEYTHRAFGPLKYIASSMTTTVTSFGELHLYQYSPYDEATDEVFKLLLKQAGTGVVRLAPWPEKPLP